MEERKPIEDAELLSSPSKRIIAELVELLGDHRDADPDLNSEDYLDDLNDRTVDAIDKYGYINGN